MALGKKHFVRTDTLLSGLLDGNETILQDLGQIPWEQYKKLLHYNASDPEEKILRGFRFFRTAFRELTARPKDILDIRSPVVRNVCN